MGKWTNGLLGRLGKTHVAELPPQYSHKSSSPSIPSRSPSPIFRDESARPDRFRELLPVGRQSRLIRASFRRDS